jgi:hypothetical protein
MKLLLRWSVYSDNIVAAVVADDKKTPSFCITTLFGETE